ncbi:MAG: ubiquinone biosynthesis regulatory protein kinase UbiB, partial [Gammaproteobacteria bacterium]
RQLYPDLDLWQTAKPFLERWMSEQVGTRAFLRNLRKNFPNWGETLPELPQLLHRTLHNAAEGKLQLEWTSKELRKLRHEMRHSNRRTAGAVVGSGLIVAGAVIYALSGTPPLILAGVPWLSWILGSTGALTVLFSQRGKSD